MPVIEIDNFRKKYPEYNDIDDATLAGKLAAKYPEAYGDLPGKVTAQPTVAPSTGSQWVQGKEPTLYEKVTNIFRDKPKEAARATLALVDSETLGINPGTAYSFKDALDKYYDIDPERKAKKESTLKAIKAFNDTGTEEGWGEAIWKNVQQVPLRIQAAGGRILQMLEETVTPETIQASLSGMSNDDAMEVFNRVARAREEKQVRSIGREFALEKEKLAAALMPNVMPGSFKDVVGSATQSTLNNIIYLIPGMKLGRAIPLVLMGGQAFGESYGEQREAGQEPTKAAAASGVKMVSEIATEFIPTGKYLKPKLSFVQRLVEAEFAEIPGESVNQIVNDVVDKVTVRPDMTVQDAIENIQKTIQVTALSTLGLSTGSHSVNKAIAKSMPDGPMKQTLNETVKDSLNRGATPQEALKIGMDAVKATPEGQAFVEKKMEKIINQAEKVKTEIDRIAEEANISNQDNETDLNTLIDSLNASEEEIDENTLLRMLSDESLEGEIEDYTGEGEKTQNQEAISGTYYRYETTGTEKQKVRYFSKQKDYVDQYQIVREQGGKTGKVIQEDITLTDPLIIEAPGNKFSDPAFENQYIEQAINNGNDGVVFRNGEDEFLAKIEQKDIVSSIKNTLNNNKGSIDITPLVTLGKSIWSEGAQSLESFTTRAKELLGDAWDKVKDFIKQVWEQVKAFNERLGERGSFSNKPKSLFNEVVRRGGLDPDKLKLNREWNEDVIENGLLGMTKTGGQGLDDIASQFQSEGIIGPTPNEFAGPEDYLLALLRDEMTGKRKVSDKKVKSDQERINQEGEQFINKESFKEGKKAGQKQERAKAKDIIENEKIRLQREFKEKTESAIKINRRSYVNEIADLMKENQWAREALTTAFRMSREAYKVGNQAGVEEQKQIIRKMLDRRSLVKNVRDYFGLSDDDLRKIARKNPLLMDDLEFKHYMQDIEELSVYYTEKAQAKFELMLKIESKRLKKVENFREAMGLPKIEDMTPKQMNDFAELLEPYEMDDTFLGKRQIEMIDRTDLKGIRTWREARERLAQETGIPILELADVQVGALDSFRWDSALREQNPFYDFLVTKMTESMMGADLQFHDVETKAYKLAKKADKSHGRTLADKAIPTDEKVMMFLESPDDTKEMIAKSMTPEQLDYAHFMQQYFSRALDYLLATKALEHGRENYFVHIRKTFLENAKEKGIVSAFKDMFKNFEEDQAVFKILDDSTGEILPLEKFFQYALHRTGYLDPTTNVTRAFLTYARTFERKRMFDSIIDKMDIYAQALTPETYTERGLETDRTLKKFVYQYINNKKGRKLSYDGALKQGGPVDMAIRGLRTFTTVLDLGLSPVTQGATFIGEQVATAVMLGPKLITKATARIKTDKGQRILEKYEAFTGRSFWEEFAAPGKEVTERLTETLFAGFHISTVLANKQFLLGSLTEKEWNSEEISPERLAEMKLDMSRFRPVPGTNSLVGSTSIGNAVMQYKTWAVAMSRNVLVDIGRFAKDLKNKPIGEALTTREAKELYRIVGITSAALIVGAMAGADDDDRTFLGKLRTRAYKEAMSLTQGMNPVFWLSTPRVLTWAYQTATALKQIVTLEEYKTKEGYKGVNNLGKQVIPRTIRDLTPDKEKGGRR